MTGDAQRTDLLAALRAELAAIEPPRRCCRLAERAGLGSAAQGRARTPLLGRLAVRLETAETADSFDWSTAAQHCRIAYMRGALLANGSLSVTAAGTHLELHVDSAALPEIAHRAEQIGHPAGMRVRRGRGVLTWKRAQTIIDLLRRVGASTTTLEIESRLLGRTLHGHLNRVVNAEHANLRRAVDAARRQLSDIEALEQMGNLRRLPTHARRVAAARRRAPEATFAELAAHLELSRGQVQRAFAVIGSAALHGDAE